MGLTKTEIFTSEQNRIALIGKALGHPARIAILQYLFRIENCFCGDLVEEIGLAQATVSQHLKELKKLGLIKGNVDGTSVCYCIDHEKWELIKEVMSGFLDRNVAPENDCC
ncbi:winged helix-turn-helix transcriptional regulator [Aureitalea sp. L0-47]|uniref:ArsR/SmtB family transcription factor n=1 Tax=Aureitalea sp. L0-47 TaxID=2816962 RepID=UPI00223829C6|nr:metalloregulator ArsR/SmtB family transcription factor [Aureitalea sp. L0-47]MCW5518377.1 winged helix-turn-helix transcriptional regulator [Aureitalea sp. L0-47]